MSRFELARKLQATCGVLRSFLGPHKALKCVIDSNSDARNCLAGTVQAFLLAADGDPTTTNLLLEALEGQAPSAADSPASGPGPGSGATWLAVFCGQLLGHVLDLVEVQGVPYECVRAGILQAIDECCEAVRKCAIELPMVAERWDEQDLMSYHEAISLLMVGADAASIIESASGPLVSTASVSTASATPHPSTSATDWNLPAFPPAASAVCLATARYPIDCAGGKLERVEAKTQADATKPWTGPTYHPPPPPSMLPQLQSPQQMMMSALVPAAAAPSDGTAGWGIHHSQSPPPPEQQQQQPSLPREGQVQAQTQLPGQVLQLLVDGSGMTIDGVHNAGSAPSAGRDRGVVRSDLGGVPLEAEAELAALEEEASWFFNDGELQAEREARAQRMLLQQLAAGMTAARVPALEMRSLTRAPAPLQDDARNTVEAFRMTTDASCIPAAGWSSLSVVKCVAAGQQCSDRDGDSSFWSGADGGGRDSGRVGAHGERDEFGWLEERTADSDTRRAAAIGGPHIRDLQPKAHDARTPRTPWPPSTPKAVPDDDEFGWFDSYDVTAHHGCLATGLGPQPAARDSTIVADDRQDTGPAVGPGTGPVAAGTRVMGPVAAGTRARAAEVAATGLKVECDGLIVAESPSTAESRSPVPTPAHGGVYRFEAAGVAATAGLNGLQTGGLRDPKIRLAGPQDYADAAPNGGRSYSRREREGLISEGRGRNVAEGKERGLSEGGVALEAEAELAALEEEASWFFNDGELQAEREARAQRRLLQQLAAGMTAVGSVFRRGDGPDDEAHGQGGRAAEAISTGSPTADEGEVRLSGSKATDLPDTDGNPRHRHHVTAPPGTSPPPPTPPLPPLPASVAMPPTYFLDSTCRRDEAPEKGVLLSSGTASRGGRGSWQSSSEITAARQRLSPLSRLVCAAAQGLSHGRSLEMQLAAAAVLLLLEPLVRRQPGDARPLLTAEMASAAIVDAKEDLSAMSALVRQAAAALQFERCVLTVEMMGRSAVAAAAMRGVVVPLATLSTAQAALAAEFFTTLPSPPPPPPPPPQSLQSGNSSPSAARTAKPATATATATVTLRARNFTSVFFQGALQVDRAEYGPIVITNAADLVTTTSDVRVEAFASHLLETIKPHGVQLLLASGHIPDALSTALHQLSGGAILALGGIGLRAIRAAAACCGVMPAASLSSLDTRRNVATHVAVELVQGGLGLGDYRAAAGHRHTETAMLLRIMKAPRTHLRTPSGGDCDASVAPMPVLRPGWVTIVSSHSLASQLEVQGVSCRTCFNRLIAALRKGHVLPGSGAWELAAAEHLTHRIKQLHVVAHRMWSPLQSGQQPMQPLQSSLAEGRHGSSTIDDEVINRHELPSPYLPLSYEAVATALRDLVGVLLQNGGTDYGSALAMAGACVAALRDGDVARLQRLATEGTGTVYDMARTAGAKAQARAPRCGEVQALLTGTACYNAAAAIFETDEQRQLAEALRVMVELKGTAAAAVMATEDGQANVAVSSAPRPLPPPPLVLDEPGAREAALRSACRLALLASSVDRVIVNR
ncbi:hypothetical protein Vafri_8835 [Volvox africanus]|uniref:Uncharacterized protein n=1 Tax=Volvox africanus TaxID=51714 RepID=A0A8J4B347_9CHLO|nr:hypothetical protein Vafri_8835 [Volvox africanus]